MNVIEAKQLSKTYGDRCVVNKLDLSVPAGQCFGLLGPNGAGKTTTLRMLLGMTTPDSGSLQVLQHAIPSQARQMRAQLGVVPQMDNLDPDFTVTENLYTYASYFGLCRKQVATRIEYLLDFANLQGKRDARIDTLSGGMQRRLTLARALINEPKILILDEPTTGLDPQARQIIWQRLRQLQNDGMTIVLTTHYMEEAQRLCDQVAIMDQGQVIACGSPQQLIHSHVEPHVVEVHGSGLERWLTERGEHLGARCERLMETVIFYIQDEQPLLRALMNQNGLEYLHRPANLEDVFLKITGRELRE
ncbi:MAG: ATP-binding cassette domain-containing protein [Gammaproteobacteria bacterium]